MNLTAAPANPDDVNAEHSVLRCADHAGVEEVPGQSPDLRPPLIFQAVYTMEGK